MFPRQSHTAVNKVRLQAANCEEEKERFSVWGAFRELLKLVETRLFVVNVSEDWLINSPEFCETASAACRDVRRIQREYYLVDDGFASGHNDEHSVSKPSVPSHDDNLIKCDVSRLNRQALQELKLNYERSLVESDCYDVDTQVRNENEIVNRSKHKESQDTPKTSASYYSWPPDRRFCS
ncbi:heterokaryon incompatibility protein [Colletotrichum asianum]